ncbi:S-layer homology domain-containing protein [Paenibacillus sp. strain BS8-2]
MNPKRTLAGAYRFIVIFVALALTFAAIPAQHAHAIVNLQLLKIFSNVFDNTLDTWNDKGPVLGGETATFAIRDDSAVGTDLERFTLSYSNDNGVTWIPLPDARVTSSESYSYNSFTEHYGSFTVPLDPLITSAIFKIETTYNPFIGARSYPSAVSKGIPVLQPGGPSDVVITANRDTSITLAWNDNSNMESYYQIERAGGKGSNRLFYVRDTKESVGPLSYVDKETEPDTYYVYTIRPVIDQYRIPVELQPGSVTRLAKSAKKSTGTLPFLDIIVLKDVPPYLLNIIKDAETIENPTPPITTPPITTPSTPGITEEQLAGASSWAKSEIADAYRLQLTTEAVIGRYTAQITREDFASVAVKLYEKLSGSPAVPSASNPFTDTANADVLKASALGIVQGTSANQFSPSAAISRQQICVMLMRAIQAALPGKALDTSAGAAFADDKQIAAWAQEGVRFAVNAKIMGGVGGNRIDPLGSTTREQAIVLVKRAYEAFVSPPGVINKVN